MIASNDDLAFKRGRKGPYSRGEDARLENWVKIHPGLSDLGNHIWEEAERNDLVQRSWSSMKDRWRKLRLKSRGVPSVPTADSEKTRSKHKDIGKHLGTSGGSCLVSPAAPLFSVSSSAIGPSTSIGSWPSRSLGQSKDHAQKQRAEVERILRLPRDACPSAVLALPIVSQTILPHIRMSYRSRSLLVHPDKCSHPNATIAFRRLSDAYKRLSGPNAISKRITVQRSQAKASPTPENTSPSKTSKPCPKAKSSATSSGQYIAEQDDTEILRDRLRRCQTCGKTRAGNGVGFCSECGSCIDCLGSANFWHCGNCNRCEDCCQTDDWSALWCDGCCSCGVCCECSGGFCPQR